MRRSDIVVAIMAGWLSAGCSDPGPASLGADAPRTLPESTAFVLAQPRVVIVAEPPPPFTYWAPEGATIKNHPYVPGIWIAELNPQNAKTYFGDECGASDYQHLVGKPWPTLTAMPPATEIRTFCTDCPRTDDLRRGRINVAIDETNSIISEIACF